MKSNILIMLNLYFRDYQRTSFLSKQKNVSFTLPLWHSWGSSLREDRFDPTLKRSRLLPSGQFPKIENNYNVFWGLLIFTAGLSKTIAKWPPLWLSLHLLFKDLTGHLKPILPLKVSNTFFQQPSSCSILMSRNSLLWRSTLLTQLWGLSFLKGHLMTVNFTHAPFSLIDCLLLRVTMTSQPGASNH